MRSPAALRWRTARGWAVITSLWVTAAIVTTAQVQIFRQLAGRPDYPVLRIYAMHLVSWLPWALLAMGLVALVQRRPLKSPGPSGILLVWAPLGLVLTLVKFALEFRIGGILRGIEPTTELLSNTFRVFLATHFPVELLTAWAVLGAGFLASRPEEAADTAPRSEGSARHARRLAIPSSGRVVLVDVETIDRVDAADYYAQIHAGGRTHLARESLSRLEERLDPGIFVRIHRSSIINVRRVTKLEPRPGGGAEVFLHDGTRRKVSRSRRKALERALSGTF